MADRSLAATFAKLAMIATLLPASAWTVLAAGTETPKPLDIGQEESVKVRLVTLDVLVLDAKDRTVPSLTAADFQLKVDRVLTKVDTLDETCPTGATDSPRSGKTSAVSTPEATGEVARRIVFVFDYLHLPLIRDKFGGNMLAHTVVLKYLRRTLRTAPISGDEIMIAVLDGALRIEQPFTRDRAEILATLARMEKDVTLYAGHFSHSSERPLFSGLEALVDLVDILPGSKALVLFSGGSGPDDSYETHFRTLTDQASMARVSIYPVDCRGLSGGSLRCPNSRSGGPGGFSRLAIDTGGHLIENADDFSLGYAWARRDLACRYTLGFYDNNPEEDHPHEVRIKIKVPGLHVVYPAGYAFRSKDRKRESLITTAFIAPGMFENGVVRTHVFPLRPRSAQTWDTMLAVDFPLPFGAEKSGKAERDFAVTVRNGPELVHSFDRKLSVNFKNAQSTTRHVSFAEPLELAPGAYTVIAVMGAPDAAKPYTSLSQIVVPPIPKGEIFLVDPVLGKRAKKNLVVHASGAGSGEGRSSDEIAKEDLVGDANSFMPLLVQRVGVVDPILAMTQACAVKKYRADGTVRVGRSIDLESGGTALKMSPAKLDLDPRGGVGCQSFVDEILVSALRPEDYVFKATLQTDDKPEANACIARFTVTPEEESPLAMPSP